MKFLLLLIIFFQDKKIFCLDEINSKLLYDSLYSKFIKKIECRNTEKTFSVEVNLGDNNCFIVAAFLYYSYYNLKHFPESLDDEWKNNIALIMLWRNKNHFIISQKKIKSILHKILGQNIGNRLVKKISRESKNKLSYYLYNNFLNIDKDEIKLDELNSIYVVNFQTSHYYSLKKLNEISSVSYAIKAFVENDESSYFDFPNLKDIPLRKIFQKSHELTQSSWPHNKNLDKDGYITIYMPVCTKYYIENYNDLNISIPKFFSLNPDEFDTFLSRNIQLHVPSGNAKYNPLSCNQDEYYRILHARFEVFSTSNQEIKDDKNNTHKVFSLFENENEISLKADHHRFIDLINQIEKKHKMNRKFKCHWRDLYYQVITDNKKSLLSELFLYVFLEYFNEYTKTTDDEFKEIYSHISIFIIEALRLACTDDIRWGIIHQVNDRLIQKIDKNNYSNITIGEKYPFYINPVSFYRDFPVLSRWVAQLQFKVLCLELDKNMDEGIFHLYLDLIQNNMKSQKLMLASNSFLFLNERKHYLNLIEKCLIHAHNLEELTILIPNFTIDDYSIIIESYYKAPSINKICFIIDKNLSFSNLKNFNDEIEKLEKKGKLLYIYKI